MQAGDDVIAELRERIRAHPEERYPVQHATAQYHLGLALAREGRAADAEAALATAARLFDGRLPLEHAKATNALGAVLRDTGRLREAAAAFERAVDLFERSDARLELGAALHNLGLVRRELGPADGSIDCFRRARELLDPDRVPAHAAAAARELGTSLLMDGDAAQAAGVLEEAAQLADRAGDAAGLGGASNALGLARLALGDGAGAVDAFRSAAGAHPRTVRPEDHAMAKANLALAHERLGDPLRARLAARQALGVPSAPEPVREQAGAILARVGHAPGGLAEVLADQPRDRWDAVVREEVARWVDAPSDERAAEIRAWVDAEASHPELGSELAESFLGALLELPPDGMGRLIAATVDALRDLDAGTRNRVREEMKMSMARFHVPQLMRLRDAFTRIATERGTEAAW